MTAEVKRDAIKRCDICQGVPAGAKPEARYAKARPLGDAGYLGVVATCIHDPDDDRAMQFAPCPNMTRFKIMVPRYVIGHDEDDARARYERFELGISQADVEDGESSTPGDDEVKDPDVWCPECCARNELWRVLTLKEVAERLTVSEAMVRRLCETGALNGVREGGRKAKRGRKPPGRLRGVVAEDLEDYVFKVLVDPHRLSYCTICGEPRSAPGVERVCDRWHYATEGANRLSE